MTKDGAVHRMHSYPAGIEAVLRSAVMRWQISASMRAFLLTRNQIRLLRTKENEPTVSSKLCVVEQQYIQEADTLIQLPMRWSEVKTQRVLLRTQMMMLKHPQMSGDDTTAARRAKYQIQTCGHTCIALSSDVRKPATEKEAKDAVQSHSIALTLRHQLSAFALGQAYGQLGS